MRVLIVDDSSSFRDAARLVLLRRGYEIAGGASDARSALTMVDYLRPDAALIDVQLPDASGFALAAHFGRLFPWIAVLLMSAEDEGTAAYRAAACGAAGFVLKEELVRTNFERFWPRPEPPRDEFA